MNSRRLTALAAALLLTGAGRVCSQDKGNDMELLQMESRLQEQRAGAMGSRLTLYCDELRKLHAQFNAAGENASADAVQQELDNMTLAVKRLTSIASDQAGPPELGELKPDEKLSGAALAARRIDAVIAPFSQAAGDGPAERNAPAGQTRPRNLRMSTAVTNPVYSTSKGGSYWTHPSAYAVWTLNDLAPGDYEVQLRYSAGTDSGGKAVVKAAGQKFEVLVPRGEKDSRKELTLTAGVIKVKDPGVDVRVENGGLADKANYLMNLHAVNLVPAGKRP